MERIIECVPNFSEGRNSQIINALVEAVRSGAKKADGSGTGVKVLNVDPGEATNRTVITFAGNPEAVVEAAYSAVAKAAELIDMRHHHGAHPRSGATDVLPLIPIAGVTLEECAEMARKLAERIANEQGIPCYCYEAAAYKPERKNLAVCRAGEYEALPQKMADAERRPDFGPGEYNSTVARSGAINVGARDFLIAVNFNLNTTSTRRANAIAFDVREKGRPMREGGQYPDGQGRQGCRGQSGDDPGNSEGLQGNRLVYRRVRHCPSVDEHYRHKCHSSAQGLRGGLPRSTGEGTQGHRNGNSGPRP